MVCNILQYGAVAQQLCYRENTAAIQRAIDEAAASGGGTVLIPDGTFYSANLFLKSNVTLCLTRGARLVASPRFEDYAFSTQPSPWAPMPGIPLLNAQKLVAFICAENAQNVTICGEGEINGQGMERRFFPAKDDPDARRPHLVLFHHCRNVRVSGIRLTDPAFFSCFAVMCKMVTVEHVIIESWKTENGDGVDLDGCRDVTVTDCRIVSGDDAVSLKTTDPAWPCADIRIKGCTFTTLWGGVRLGTESSADMRNVLVEDCVFLGCNDGIKIQDCATGVYENITVQRCVMHEVHRPVFMTLGRFRLSKKDASIRPKLGGIRNVTLRDIIAHVSAQSAQSERNCMVISGCPDQKIEDVRLQNVQVFFHEQGHTEGEGRCCVPEYLDYSFLYADIFSINGYLPCFGPFIRHVQGLELSDCGFFQLGSDSRPAIFAYDVQKAAFRSVKVSPNAAVFLTGTALDVTMQACWLGEQPVQQPQPLSQQQMQEFEAFTNQSEQVNARFDAYAALIDEAQRFAREQQVAAESWLGTKHERELRVTLAPFTRCVVTIPLYGNAKLYCNGALAAACDVPKAYRGLLLWPVELTQLAREGETVLKLCWDDAQDVGGVDCVLPFGAFRPFACGVHGVTSLWCEETAHG